MTRDDPPKNDSYDLAIAGGGLAGGLIALALHKLRPEWKVALIEAEDHFGGNHLWSFFDSDIESDHRWLVDPLIAQQWGGYDVHFPKYSRQLDSQYYTIKSSSFDQHIRRTLPQDSLKLGRKIAGLSDGLVQLDDGTAIAAKAVLDARGGGDLSALDFGWQKFCGQMLRLKAPHGLERPIIMDATVDQIDGYRFVYCLPFSPTEIFVEDTYYSDGKAIDEEAMRERIASYAADHGWEIEAVLEEEQGQLPVLYGGDFGKFWAKDAGVRARAGARAALIQPITSYSLPLAVKTAMMIADLPYINQKKLDQALTEFASDHWDDSRFYRMLCAMMFKAAKPEQRYRTLEHTYAKDKPLIERFYAGKTTLRDKMMLLSGRPPVPIFQALRAMLRYR